MQTMYQTMSDGVPVAVHQWLPQNEPVAVLHIVHGMAEHALRYDGFAEEACKKGFAVFAADHRGHGKTVSDQNPMGYLADGDGFRRVVTDQKELNIEIKKRYPALPVIIIGHSFGSFITQEYIEQYGKTVSAVILIGSGGPNASVRLASVLANINCLFKGRKSAANFMNTLVFGSYNSKIKNPKTRFDWLSRDENEVKKYIDDRLCGFICTAGFYQDFMRGLKRIHKGGALQGIPVVLPIFIIAGSEDPVSNGGKTLKILHRLYEDIGIKDVALKLYDGARHELLNELNKEAVKTDIFEWIEKKVEGESRIK